MENFSVIKDGKEYWISRSIAVACFVFKKLNKKWYVLANKRGSGTPDFQGYWNCPCGYLDYDETLEQAASREVKEECNIDVTDFTLVKIDSNPNSNRQNVTISYMSIYEGNAMPSVGTGGEKDEVADAKWIPVSMINQLQWAFNHNTIITELSKQLK